MEKERVIQKHTNMDNDNEELRSKVSDLQLEVERLSREALPQENTADWAAADQD